MQPHGTFGRCQSIGWPTADFFRMRRALVTTVDSHGSCRLMRKHGWPTGFANGADERTDCEADFATAVSRLESDSSSTSAGRVTGFRRWMIRIYDASPHGSSQMQKQK